MSYAIIALNHLVYYCGLLLRFGDVERNVFWYRQHTRASNEEPGNRERKAIGLGRPGPRLFYDHSGRTSFPECPVRVSGTKNRSDGDGRERSQALGNIETQDVLLCHPRTADLLVMNIVARGDTRSQRAAWRSPKNMYRTPAYAPPPPLHPPRAHVGPPSSAEMSHELRIGRY